MIRQLRKKFIRISIAAVASVMVLLCVAVNVAYFLSVDADLNDMISMISENHGRMPDMNVERMFRPDDEAQERPMPRRFNEETPFSTRFFVLYYTADGTLLHADLDKIAAVEDSDVQSYLAFALKQGEGSGYTDGYKYSIRQTEEGSYEAVFLNDYEQIGTVRTILIVSVLATAACIALISVMIVLFSKKAMAPVIESDRRQKQFITDASHELKTPVTVIRTSLRVLEMEVGKQKWIDKATAQTDKLTDLINSLVTLSRMNEGENTFRPAEFNVSDALAETAESFADFAEENGHTLNVQVEPDIRYVGDAYAVRQLASVLLDNAIKYASDGSDILFSLEKAKKGIVVRTRNGCDDLNGGDPDKLFDRFYRADPSRSNEKSGFGIGLSIARTICEAHHGSIRSHVADDGQTIEFIAVLK